MAVFGVSPDKEQALAERMEALGIRETDIVEKFIRSGGHGGQNVTRSPPASTSSTCRRGPRSSASRSGRSPSTGTWPAAS